MKFEIKEIGEQKTYFIDNAEVNQDVYISMLMESYSKKEEHIKQLNIASEFSCEGQCEDETFQIVREVREANSDEIAYDILNEYIDNIINESIFKSVKMSVAESMRELARGIMDHANDIELAEVEFVDMEEFDDEG